MAETPDKIDASYREVFGGNEGKKVLRHLMANNLIWEPTFDQNSHAMALNEGKRTVVLGILHRIRYKPEAAEFVNDLTEAQFDYASTD